VSFVVCWLVLAALWFGLSGYTDTHHLVFGVVSVTLVSLLSHRHMTGGDHVGRGLLALVRLALYVPWLLWQILLANVDVMLRVFGVRPIEPCVIRFKPPLEGDFAVVTLANSITLTPGTVTVDVEPDGTFVVHAISREAADGVLTGVMAAKARHVAGEA
jgi:multicomponent Na+:H+ antiporter subunit E